jgi:sorbitol/mannitol transport system permease protein
MSQITDVGPVPATRTTTGKPRPDRKPRGGAFLGVVAWIVGIIFVLPILWMLLTSFHSEADAATNPPSRVRPAHPAGLPGVLRRLDRSQPVAPAAELAHRQRGLDDPGAAARRPGRPTPCRSRRVEKWTDVMFFFLSTKMLPIVAGLLPIYLFAQRIGMLDNIWL